MKLLKPICAAVFALALSLPSIADAQQSITLPAKSLVFLVVVNHLKYGQAGDYSKLAPMVNIPPMLLFAIDWQESGWRQHDTDGQTLVSGDGGIGIMQLTGATASQFDVNQLASNIDYNITQVAT